MKRRFLTVFFILWGISAQAQNWGGGVDSEPLHFGFTFQYISSEFKILKKPDWRKPFYDPTDNSLVTDSLAAISSRPTPGFGLGFVSDLALGKNVNLRFTPALVFTDRQLTYEYMKPLASGPFPGDESISSPNSLIRKVQATMVDLPIGFKLKTDRLMNFRAYLIGGLKYSVDIVSKKKTNDIDFAYIDKLVKNKRSILAYEAGLGCDFYFEFFKLSSELKLSNSFNSVLNSDYNPYSQPLEKLFLRNLQFSLYFE